MSGPFVGNGESPAAGASDLPFGIPSVSNRASAGNHDHTRAAAKRGLHRDHHIAHHFDFARDHLGDQPSHNSRDFRTSSARDSHTGSFNLRRSNPGRRTGLPYGSAQTLARLALSPSNHVTARARPGAQHRSLVADKARSLAAAAVNTEEKAHQRTCITGSIRRGSDALPIGLTS